MTLDEPMLRIQSFTVDRYICPVCNSSDLQFNFTVVKKDVELKTIAQIEEGIENGTLFKLGNSGIFKWETDPSEVMYRTKCKKCRYEFLHKDPIDPLAIINNFYEVGGKNV